MPPSTTIRTPHAIGDGSISLEAADASTWILRDRHWLCALHTESLLGDPFGRDRTKA